jgi:FKBP-type peptidyl-prolyl cis-trans isomerase 2
MAVQKGNTLQVEYEGRFLNGEVFDASSRHGQPLEFVAGEGMVVPGFDNAVLGMNIGEEKEIKLAPQEGYGLVNPQAIQKVPKANFPPQIQVGMQIGIPLPNGGAYPAMISAIDEQEVTLDMNHPLAGKTLVFKVKVLGILQ